MLNLPSKQTIMRPIFSILLITAAFLTVVSPSAAQESASKFKTFHQQQTDSLRVLWIGNSFTFYNDVPKMVEEMGKENGLDISVTLILKGGERFSGHLQNPELHRQLERGVWDYVIMQEFSSTPAYSTKYVAENILPYAAKIDSLAKKYSPGVETIYYMTWGHKYGNTRQTDYPLDDTYEQMQDRIATTYIDMAYENKGTVSPVGIAWRNIRRNHPEIELYIEDNFHPSLAGSYLAANTIFASIYGRPFKLYKIEGLTIDEMEILHAEAEAAAFAEIQKVAAP